MNKLHLVATEDFSYLNYLSVMTAARSNNLVVWFLDEPNNAWWDLVKGNRSIEFRQLEGEPPAIVLDPEDNTGRMDMLYLLKFDKDKIDDAFVKHGGLFLHKDEGEFEKKDMQLITVHLPEGEKDHSFITPEWVKTSDTLLAELIQTICLKRIWNPHERD